MKRERERMNEAITNGEMERLGKRWINSNADLSYVESK